MQAWLIISQNLYCFALSQQDIAYCRILQGPIIFKIIFQSFFSSCLCAFHQFIDVCAAHCDRQKAYGRQYGETSPDIVRHYKALISLFCSKVLQSSSGFVGRSIYSLCCALFSIFIFQNLFKYTEGNGWLCSSS